MVFPEDEVVQPFGSEEMRREMKRETPTSEREEEIKDILKRENLEVDVKGDMPNPTIELKQDGDKVAVIHETLSAIVKDPHTYEKLSKEVL